MTVDDLMPVALACGFNRITTKNVADVYARIAVYHRLNPAQAAPGWAPWAVSQLIGTRFAGVPAISRIAFARRVAERAMRRAEDEFTGHDTGEHRASVA